MHMNHEGQVNLCMCNTSVHAGKTARITACQKSVLEAAFVNSCYLNETTLKQLVEQTGLGEQKISGWFKRKRDEIRHERKEGTLSMCEYIKTYMYIHAYIHTCDGERMQQQINKASKIDKGTLLTSCKR